MKSGIKFEDIEKGKGREALENDYVLVECLFFLNLGEQIEIFGNYHDNKFLINLNSRDFIPGLRYGIIGMNEGGTRNLKISPHLAFGEKGLANKIPPNALLICKVKLLEIVDEKFSLPDPFLRKRQVVITHRGEAESNKPKWIFGIIDGEY
jgi:FKBP-type peptidyl-prolyl cis-trans isomerases 1